MDIHCTISCHTRRPCRRIKARRDKSWRCTTPCSRRIRKKVNSLVNEFFVNSKGPMGEAARSNLEKQDRREREANRGVRRTMKECIKPENVIDDDVKECIEGVRSKEW